MKKISNIVLTNEDGSTKSDIQMLAALNHEGQRRIPFDKLSEYCMYKKTIRFLTKKFKKVGYIPNFFVENDFFYIVKVFTYIHKGHTYESCSLLPVCRAYGRFKKYELSKYL